MVLAVADYTRSRPSSERLPRAIVVRKNDKLLEDHPIANLFPFLYAMETEPNELTGEKQFNQLVENMKREGFDPAQPILLYEGKILDGWESLSSRTIGWRGANHGALGTAKWRRPRFVRFAHELAPATFEICGPRETHRGRGQVTTAAGSGKIREGGRKGRENQGYWNALQGCGPWAAPFETRVCRDTATDVGVSKRTVARYRQMQAKHPDLWRRFQNREISWKVARRMLDAQLKEDRLIARERENQRTPPQTNRYRLFAHSDILSAPVKDDSLAAIITDPFYGKGHLECYESLAEFAAKKLRQGGNLIGSDGTSQSV